MAPNLPGSGLPYVLADLQHPVRQATASRSDLWQCPEMELVLLAQALVLESLS